MLINCGNLKMNYVDYVVVIDKDYHVIFNTRYESQVNSASQENNGKTYVNKKLFEVYPDANIKTSSFVECLTTGKTVIRLNQTNYDFYGVNRCTNNITMPIIRNGIILGAVEIAKDVTTMEDVNDFVSEAEESIGRLDFEKYKKAEESKEILTNNTTMIENIEKAKLFARYPNPTLIYGETGTGKELFAQLMISESGVSKKSVVTQNCAAVPDNLIESILFGTKKGAYTGAENTKGLFQEADGGILFLDELSAMPYKVQGKLLRAIQEGTFRPVGSNDEIHVDVKVIAAMNIDPIEAMNNKIIRKDLFYRFSSCMIGLPPLRERVEDIEFYAKYFKDKYVNIYNKKINKIDDRLIEMLKAYSWEGNVRELKHLIEFMVSVCNEEILNSKFLPTYVLENIENENRSYTNDRIIGAEFDKCIDYCADNFNLRDALKKQEMEIIYAVLKLCNGNKSMTSEKLGIPRQTLNYKLKTFENNNSQNLF